MKTHYALSSLCAAIALSIAANACAQADPAGSGIAASAITPGKKEIRAANRRLQKAVIRALGSAKGLNAANIGVVARDGAVVLRGSVTDSAQSQIAAAVASSVSGVTAVRNDLLIRPE
ncbi:BON domain-containing protein [Burkholderia cenocepacia]|jgi:osmotically-inducible protein OsmY|uniref:BON domain-containing protein n=1 Tax=Burkholderia cenocepacia TaxID=95486 RepID=UPI0002343A99|nr:BON domain-containing protein [Burkholderia cenocepacia]MCW3656862.1 BON domain-containing protein [Burkholderia cenocepacia]MDI9677639.1 BON domain-containing protein [Burkholderia cenocepacia]MDN7689947.1 BON domain-containing protein [Burkholderia cenocepacia]MDN7827350.1 BON domain-containing protein [Burkholderia cenocepacia]MDR8046549.1 BON domain-containing protein [Burkholderia cenocepacia]